MLQLTQINIFPVKSLDGYSPEIAKVEMRGLQYDRRWMITEPDGLFITQRTHGKMTLLRATVKDNSLVIEEKQNEQNRIKIPLQIKSTTVAEVVVWDDTVRCTNTTKEADEWLSDFLGQKCHLVYMPDSSYRQVESDYNRGDDIVSFADAYPFLIAGAASMQDLNDKIQKNVVKENPNPGTFTPLVIKRFRPNFVFHGGVPFLEDTFTDFKIGDVYFVGVKPCARCVLTTRDPDTGNMGKEPLATLSTFRKKDKKVLFGQNIVWNDQKWKGTGQPMVKVGDVINCTG